MAVLRSTPISPWLLPPCAHAVRPPSHRGRPPSPQPQRLPSQVEALTATGTLSCAARRAWEMTTWGQLTRTWGRQRARRPCPRRPDSHSRTRCATARRAGARERRSDPPRACQHPLRCGSARRPRASTSSRARELPRPPHPTTTRVRCRCRCSRLATVSPALPPQTACALRPCTGATAWARSPTTRCLTARRTQPQTMMRTWHPRPSRSAHGGWLALELSRPEILMHRAPRPRRLSRMTAARRRARPPGLPGWQAVAATLRARHRAPPSHLFCFSPCPCAASWGWRRARACRGPQRRLEKHATSREATEVTASPSERSKLSLHLGRRNPVAGSPS
mmetsp:Transcript_8835/g.24406  ORF Transcript_8835/g.24406 Transcript_8835/m.24406 type:complete len:335 (+) Transcript_8835:1916-2920(+)